MRLSCALAGTAPRASLAGFRQSREFSHLASAAAVQRIPAHSSAPAVGVASASAGRCARGLRQGSQLGDFAETLPGTAGARCFAQACALEDSRRELTPPRAVLDTAAPATCSPHGAAAPTTARSTQAGSRRPDLAAVNDSFLALDARNESFTAPKATGAGPATDFAGALAPDAVNGSFTASAQPGGGVRSGTRATTPEAAAGPHRRCPARR
jgi:hypothetical protein